jgi:catechol 2,3-dioxygenase-like lactoylglutathione lyase family enzyme
MRQAGREREDGMTVLRAMPVIDVRDVAAAEAFWRRAGFASHGIWGDPPAFAIVQRGDATLALSRAVGEPPRNGWWAAYVYVDDVEALHAELAAEGLAPGKIRSPEHYGCRDFDLVDPDGNRVAFGQALHPVPGPGLGEARGRG